MHVARGGFSVLHQSIADPTGSHHFQKSSHNFLDSLSISESKRDEITEPLTTSAQRRLVQIHFVRYRDRTVGNMEMPVVCPDAAWSRVPALSAQRLDLGVCGAEIHKIALFHSLYGYGLRHKSSENSRIRLKSYLCALNAGTRDQAVSGQTDGISMYSTGLSL